MRHRRKERSGLLIGVNIKRKGERMANAEKRHERVYDNQMPDSETPERRDRAYWLDSVSITEKMQ